MIDRTTKLRWRRRVRRRQQQLEGIGSTTEEQLDRHFFRRLGRLYEVRRFILTWLLLVVLLAGATVIQTRALGGYYQVIKPVAGGIYSEGIVGSFTNANPIFATSDVDAAVSRLVFSSLLKYDAEGRLVGDLADTVTPDTSGKVYTAVLRKDARWHDGAAVTSKDVAFTFQTIQNPDAKSPLFSSWQGIQVTAPDANTVVFTLPNIFAPFPHSLTSGILPEHLLGKTGASSLRSALFNTTQPVGSGPFKWNRVELQGGSSDNREQRISLSPNENYYKGGPKLNEFTIRAFLDENHMMASFDRGELTAMAGVEDISEDKKEELTINQYNIPISGSVMIFFRTSQDILKDATVRRALAAATNQQTVLSRLSYPSVATKEPFLHSMIGYNPGLWQQGFDAAQANSLLDGAGWVKGADGIRVKDGIKLRLELNTLSNLEYASVASEIKKEWKEFGVDLMVTSLDQKDLQTAIDNRSYSVLLYGITLGTDPDQFAYWHSSQADVHSGRRLNFSDYKSPAADAALETGRTRLDANLRAAKYEPFLVAWRNDVPAVTLYQPRFLYVTRGAVFNFSVSTLTSPADRFTDVETWMVRTKRVTE